MKTPILIIISAPSGAGKSTLCQRLLKELPDLFQFSISSTTRAPRGQEVNGKEYFFLSHAEFKDGIEKGLFAEWAKVHDQYYGTSKATIESAFKNKKNVILDIDVQGAGNLKKSYPDRHLDIFIAPPSLEELEKRLKGRGTDEKAVIEKRLKNARNEMARMNEFSVILINDDLDRTYAKFKSTILKAIGQGSGTHGSV